MGGWTVLSNHGQVLVAIARTPNGTEREIALRVGITERAVQRIIADLEAAGCLTRERAGRRNRYELHLDRPLRHPLAGGATLGDLLAALARPGHGAESGPTPRPPTGPAAE